MSNAVMPLSDYKNACDTIREKTESTDTIKSGELADKVNEVYEKGKQAEYDAFWDKLQNYGEPIEMWGGFAYEMWNNETFKPKYPIYPKNTASYLFYSARFYECNVDVNMTRVPALGNFCYNNLYIKKIKKVILKSDGSQTFSNAFVNATNLESIEFEGVIGNNITFASCPLNRESILSVFNCLHSTASGKTLTLSKNVVNNAFSGGSTGTEWLNLVATKPNWTISLS